LGKIIGIDFGTKRVGIALTDDLGMIASPIEAIHSSELTKYLKKQIEENNVTAIVLGLPKGLRGEDTDSTKQVLELQKHLQRTFKSTQLHMVNERFTSKIAKMAMVQGNVPKSKRSEKGMIDKISAALILQSFLDQRG